MSAPIPPRPRLLPEEPLPPYTFVPGRQPHPQSDPAGHLHGIPPPRPTPLDPAHWPLSRDYLHGLDLFNHGFWWESHLYWEALWLAAGRKGTTADFLKGLIQLAAAGVKHLEGIPRGVCSHARRAAELWGAVAHSLGNGQTHYLGLEVGELIRLAEEVGRRGWPNEPPLLLPAFPPGPGESLCAGTEPLP